MYRHFSIKLFITPKTADFLLIKTSHSLSTHQLYPIFSIHEIFVVRPL